MDDSFAMEVMNRQSLPLSKFYDLGEPVKDLCFCEYFTLLLHISDSGIHITAIAIYHNDVQALLSKEGIFKGDNVGVPEFL